jgi:hypothetical protein
MQSLTQWWCPTCARLTGGLRTNSSIQIPSWCYRQRNYPTPYSNPVCVSARTCKVHVHFTRNSLTTSDWVLEICRQVFTLGSPPPNRWTMINSNRSIKRIAQTLRVYADQWLAKFYDLEWVLILFVDKPRKCLDSSESAMPWKNEIHDFTVDTLSAICATWIEWLKRVVWNKSHYYR